LVGLWNKFYLGPSCRFEDNRLWSYEFFSPMGICQHCDEASGIVTTENFLALWVTWLKDSVKQL
jgi:hypothetical protein